MDHTRSGDAHMTGHPPLPHQDCIKWNRRDQDKERWSKRKGVGQGVYGEKQYWGLTVRMGRREHMRMWDWGGGWHGVRIGRLA